MNKKILDKIFIAYLKRKKCYQTFRQYCEYKNLDNFCSLPARISSTFTWSDTPQGHNFWRKLDNEWDDFVFENWIHFQMI